MILARVVGNVVASAKHTTLDGKKLMMVRPEDPDGSPSGDELLAVDGVGAGVGERVLVLVEGKSVGEVLRTLGAPIDAAIVGIVDHVDLG